MVEMGQIKVFVQELGLKQGFLADTNMDYLTSEWPRRLGPKILKLAPISMFSLKIMGKNLQNELWACPVGRD